MSHTLGKYDTSGISGNAEPKIKQYVAWSLDSKTPYNTGVRFAQSIQNRLKVVEVSFNKKTDEPKKLETRIVLEITVEEDMLNGANILHGGCSAYLVDVCSSLPILAFTQATHHAPTLGVTSSINMIYHSPAGLGDKLRIINTTMTVGSRTMSARSEIWNATHHRLVSSGVHIKMRASPPKAKL